MSTTFSALVIFKPTKVQMGCSHPVGWAVSQEISGYTSMTVAEGFLTFGFKDGTVLAFSTSEIAEFQTYIE